MPSVASPVTTRRRAKNSGSGGIRTHASEETGALNQRLRPLGHATDIRGAHATVPHRQAISRMVLGSQK